jgi:succinate-acetate transporter protein
MAQKEAAVDTYMVAQPRPHAIRANPAPLGLICFGMTTWCVFLTTTSWRCRGPY